MNYLVWLILVAVLVVLVVLTGATPKGGKPVARTRLMKAARFFLVAGIVLGGTLALLGAIKH